MIPFKNKFGTVQGSVDPHKTKITKTGLIVGSSPPRWVDPMQHAVAMKYPPRDPKRRDSGNPYSNTPPDALVMDYNKQPTPPVTAKAPPKPTPATKGHRPPKPPPQPAYAPHKWPQITGQTPNTRVTFDGVTVGRVDESGTVVIPSSGGAVVTDADVARRMIQQGVLTGLDASGALM